jgi:hypothetical protein
LLRLMKASALSSKPGCSRFQRLRSAGTNRLNVGSEDLIDKILYICLPIRTIFFQLEWFMWESRTSCRWAKVIPRKLREMLFSGAHNVSIISPSTCFAPGIKLGEYRGRQESWWPWMWNNPIPVRSSNELGRLSSGLFLIRFLKLTRYWHMISYMRRATGMSFML